MRLIIANPSSFRRLMFVNTLFLHTSETVMQGALRGEFFRSCLGAALDFVDRAVVSAVDAAA